MLEIKKVEHMKSIKTKLLVYFDLVLERNQNRFDSRQLDPAYESKIGVVDSGNI